MTADVAHELEQATLSPRAVAQTLGDADAALAGAVTKVEANVRGPVLWTREEDIQHDMYRPYWVDRLSAGLDAKGMPVAWINRFAGSSVRLVPPFFKNGLEPDSTEGADRSGLRDFRVEPPGFPTSSGGGPSHNVFATESFVDELAAAAKQDPVSYRRALLDKSPRAKAVLELAGGKTDWGQALPTGVGRGVSLQFVFGTYLAAVAEVEVARSGEVRVRRVVCALACGTGIAARRRAESGWPKTSCRLRVREFVNSLGHGPSP